MKTDTIQYKGCTINVHQDECPENPFEAWDCEPPILAFYAGRHGYAKSYNGAPEDIGDIVNMLPDSLFARGSRIKLVREYLNLTMYDFAERVRECGDVKSAFTQSLEDQIGSKPEGWRDALEWFEMAESLLNLAGIVCYNGQSNGYSQGDSTLVLAIAMPEWAKKVGASPDSLAGQCESAFKLYGQWAWGDVYGYTCEDENGDDIPDASCWGFYGYDNEESGLLESAHHAIDCHLDNRNKETAAILDMVAFA